MVTPEDLILLLAIAIDKFFVVGHILFWAMAHLLSMTISPIWRLLMVKPCEIVVDVLVTHLTIGVAKFAFAALIITTALLIICSDDAGVESLCPHNGTDGWCHAVSRMVAVITASDIGNA